MRKAFFLTTLAVLLAALPVAASDSVIYSGLDLWQTTDDGSTRSDFREEPIPADFFCRGSEAFDDTIQFRGVPIVTSPANALAYTDTIVHRLDDATFDEKGTAYTRVQLRAMAFESLAPVETLCGDFNVAVTLDGEQPITKMQILRDSDEGGRFFSPISVIVKMSFIYTDGRKQEPIEISRRLDFAPMGNGRWTPSANKNQVTAKGFVMVDTNGDGQPDTTLPGTSNFIATSGISNPATPGQKLVDVPQSDCHCDYNSCGHIHCVNNSNCPTDSIICDSEAF